MLSDAVIRWFLIRWWGWIAAVISLRVPDLELSQLIRDGMYVRAKEMVSEPILSERAIQIVSSDRLFNAEC
ncbi:hypothetical protein DSO57_1026007 [Entomophthora muscae]|uniref:Uncharacterized protein n=1 Tax=Entomophthora muscae TaxID=34485 RepID=A0ACC2RTA9_9FUNG|nr:hypothetical protein DSO57_1026007 [Entomophthora muscae]